MPILKMYPPVKSKSNNTTQVNLEFYEMAKHKFFTEAGIVYDLIHAQCAWDV